MKRFERILKITAIICSVIFVMGLFGTIVGVNKFFNGDFKSLEVNNKYFKKGEVVTNSFEKSKVKSLDIDGDVCNVTIKENSNLNEVKVTSSHKEYTKMELVDGILKLEFKDSKFKKGLFNLTKLFGVQETSRSLVVELPKDLTLEEAKLDMNLGEINIENGNYKSLDVSTKIGSTKISNEKYTLIDKLNVNNDMGDTEITNIDGINTEITNAMGKTSINIDNNINPSVNLLKINNSMGDININLANIDRNIEISCSMGSVDLISKNHLSRDVDVNLNSSMGDSQNNFKYNDSKLNKSVKVNVDVNMGSAKLNH